ncbi:hypothetical protein [Sphingomonas aquatica]|uniref:hypothetical protein n=2 Tax=Sphingomonas TaxID=13687 RepID=UPI00301C4EC6
MTTDLVMFSSGFFQTLECKAMENRKPEMPNLDGVDAASPWSGFAEVSEAIRDNRLMEYQIKKSLADPWARSLTLAVLVVIAAGFSYLAGASFGLW